METWVLPALLGLGLAASTGLKTFLPLLMLAVAARFQMFGIELSGPFVWLGSIGAVTALSIATATEFVADKVPFVDHALSLFGVVARPAAGALAAAAAFNSMDPAAAAVAGLIIGAPTALAVHTAQSGTRIASTATTGGLANPLVSLAEDVAAFFTALLAMVVPILVPLVLLVAGLVVWRVIATLRGGSRLRRA